ncbi:MAG TPA: signal peptidase II, partial [Rubrobacter sp.]|nr:signal peptidase II [Rubrobacter sp.]
MLGSNADEYPDVFFVLMMSRRMGLVLALVLALVVFAVDQGIKSAIEGSMRVGESIILVPGFLSITYIRNDGGAFGILSGSQVLLLVGSA